MGALSFVPASQASLSADDLSLLQMAQAVREVPLARFMLDAVGDVETPVLWDDPVGLPCKCRPDKRMPSTGTVLDIKSSSDGSPWAFQKSLLNFNYALASRHYSSGCQAERFVWLVVDIEPPHEVFIYELDDESSQVAERQYRGVVSELAAAIETDDWGLVPQGITKLSLPKWAMPKEANATS
jgi:hypothetical protein